MEKSTKLKFVLTINARVEAGVSGWASLIIKGSQMKLVIPAKALGRRITLLVTAFVLAVSSLTAAVPFVLSETASATAGPSVLGTGFDYLQGWTNDRHTPSGGYGMTSSTLSMNVDGDAGSTSTNKFYWTEGRKASLPVAAESLKATLHLDPEWKNKVGVRAGLWAVTAANPAAFPIVEFSNRNEANDQQAGEPRFQVWNTTTGSWTTVNVPMVYGNDYEFEVVFNDEASRFEFYVNGAQVHSYSAAYGAFDEVIFNQYNSHIAGNDYNVTWKGFAASNYSGTPETTLGVATGASNAVNALSSGAVGDKFVVRGQATDDNDLSRVYVQLNKSTGGRFGGTTVHLDGKSDDWSVLYDASDLGFVNGDKVRAHVSVTDTKGKTSSVGWTNFMTVDASQPTVTLTSPIASAAGGDMTRKVVTFSGTASDAVSGIAGNQVAVTLRAQSTNPANCGADKVTFYAPVASNGTWSTTYDTEALADGKYCVKVVVRDNAGNQNGANGLQAKFFTVDNSEPVASITNPTDSAFISGTVPVRITVSDDTELAAYSYRIRKVNNDNSNVAGLPAIVDKVVNSADGLTDSEVFSWNTETQGNGRYYVYVSARDVSGNRFEQRAYVTVDNTKPDFGITSPLDQVTVGPNFTVKGTASDSLSGIDTVDYNVRHLSGFDGATSGGAVVKSTASYDEAAGEWVFDLNGLAEGYYRVAVTAKDEAGNSRGRHIDVYVDATGPNLSLVENPWVNSFTVPTIMGTTQPGKVVELTIATPTPITTFVTADTSGNWVYTHSSTLPVGTYNVSARAVDGYGNPTVRTTTLTIFAPVVVPTAPVVPFDPSPSNDGENEEEEESLFGALTTATPQIVNPSSAVLGTNSQEDDDNVTGTPEVKGTNTADKLADVVGNTDGNALGLAWYWWLLIIAGGSTIIWGIASAFRGRPSDL